MGRSTVPDQQWAHPAFASTAIAWEADNNVLNPSVSCQSKDARRYTRHTRVVLYTTTAPNH